MGAFNRIKSSLEKALKKGQHKLVKGIEKHYFYKESDYRDETDEFLSLFRPTCWLEFWGIVVITVLIILGGAIAYHFSLL